MARNIAVRLPFEGPTGVCVPINDDLSVLTASIASAMQLHKPSLRVVAEAECLQDGKVKGHASLGEYLHDLAGKGVAIVAVGRPEGHVFQPPRVNKEVNKAENADTIATSSNQSIGGGGFPPPPPPPESPSARRSALEAQFPPHLVDSLVEQRGESFLVSVPMADIFAMLNTMQQEEIDSNAARIRQEELDNARRGGERREIASLQDSDSEEDDDSSWESWEEARGGGGGGGSGGVDRMGLTAAEWEQAVVCQ